jgi:hypothetical protein
VPTQIEQRDPKARLEQPRLQAKVTRAAAEAVAKNDAGVALAAERFRVKLHPFPKHGIFSVVKLDPAADPLIWE